jgi:molybdate transport system regulatory protein
VVYYNVGRKIHSRKHDRVFPSLKGHIWLEGSEGTFLGYGRIALLERIIEYGSITKAAKALEMSYRRAWVLIDSMNRQVPKPYVITSPGGKRFTMTSRNFSGARQQLSSLWKMTINSLHSETLTVRIY